MISLEMSWISLGAMRNAVPQIASKSNVLLAFCSSAGLPLLHLSISFDFEASEWASIVSRGSVFIKFDTDTEPSAENVGFTFG